jgi:hypothetical protein
MQMWGKLTCKSTGKWDSSGAGPSKRAFPAALQASQECLHRARHPCKADPSPVAMPLLPATWVPRRNYQWVQYQKIAGGIR